MALLAKDRAIFVPCFQRKSIVTTSDTYFLCDRPIEILAAREELDFFDTQSIILNDRIKPLDAWNAIMANPLPGMKTAFALRDAVSSRFGVRRIGGFSGHPVESVVKGDKIDFFLVEAATEDRLTLTERDRHLDVMTCISVEDRKLSITSSVKIHNLFGKAYMLPVAPAHKLIVRTMLHRLAAQMHKVGYQSD